MASLSVLYIGLVICYVLYKFHILKHTKLTLDIIIPIVAKVAFLTIIYLLFFSGSDKKTPEDLEKKIFLEYKNERDGKHD